MPFIEVKPAVLEDCRRPLELPENQLAAMAGDRRIRKPWDIRLGDAPGVGQRISQTAQAGAEDNSHAGGYLGADGVQREGEIGIHGDKAVRR